MQTVGLVDTSRRSTCLLVGGLLYSFRYSLLPGSWERRGGSSVFLELPNSAPHPDAREASHPLSPSQSRAGGRER